MLSSNSSGLKMYVGFKKILFDKPLHHSQSSSMLLWQKYENPAGSALTAATTICTGKEPQISM